MRNFQKWIKLLHSAFVLLNCIVVVIISSFLYAQNRYEILEFFTVLPFLSSVLNINFKAIMVYVNRTKISSVFRELENTYPKSITSRKVFNQHLVLFRIFQYGFAGVMFTFIIALIFRNITLRFVNGSSELPWPLKMPFSMESFYAYIAAILWFYWFFISLLAIELVLSLLFFASVSMVAVEF